MKVTLREITADTVRAVTRLAVAPAQSGFVASNAVSLAQALFSDEAWYRAIHADDELVGFVMLADETLKNPPSPAPKIGLWRLMIDQRHQRRGIGREAMRLVLEQVRSRPGVSSFYTSYVDQPGGPGPFYRGLCFEPNGEIDDGEVVLVYPLERVAPVASVASVAPVASLASDGAAQGMRGPPIMNLADAVFDDIEDNGLYTSRRASIGQHIGAKQLGYNLTELAPGKAQCPFHSHRVDEEMFLILEGTGLLRYGDQRLALKPHDVIACPVGGPESAHQIINTGTVPLRYLALSNNSPSGVDLCEYPDSNKVLVWTDAAHAGGSLRKLFRAETTVDYYDRESLDERS